MGRGAVVMGVFNHLIAQSEDVAFRLGDEALTYRSLWHAAQRVAAHLKVQGIGPGDRVAVQASTSLDLVITLLGHLAAGVIHVPINTRYKRDEVQHILDDSGACLLLTDESAPEGARGDGFIHGLFRQDLKQWVQAALSAPALPVASSRPSLPSPDAVAMLIYTSGTTGKSKGVMLSRRAIEANVGATTSGWRFGAEDMLALALPLFHVHGLCLGVLGTLMHGMTATLIPRFTPEGVLSALETGATVFMGVPTMYSRLVSHLEAQGGAAEAMRTARLFTSGSAALPAPLHARFYELTGHAILERYGMSETGFTLSNPYEGHRQPGTVGFPVKGYEIKILADDGALCAVDEQGELWVRGDGLMEGYWGQPKATAAVMDDGWFRTGDVVVRQRDGYLRIQGRASADIIKSGGFKISALEIEAVLLQHPEVGEAAVVGLPDSEWGESIAAAIVPRTPDGVLDTAALSSFVADRIATYKQPRFIWVTDVLPRNALGKLQKHLLRPMLIAAQD